MTPVSIFKRLIRLAAWATPHIQRWYREYNVNRSEGERHLAVGNFAEAEKYLVLASADAQRRRSSIERRVEIQLQLAEARRGQGKLEDAERTALDAVEQSGEKGAIYARCLETLSSIYVDQGRLSEALEASQQAFEISRISKTVEPTALAQRCHKLALVQQRAGNHAAARASFREAMQLYERAFGANHPETASRLTDLGAALQSEGSHREALLCLQRALKIHQTTLGPDCPEATRDMVQIALVHHANGDLEEAAQQYERALRFKEKQLGGDPRELASLLSSAGELYLTMGRHTRAQELLQQAASLLQRHPEALAKAPDVLGKVYEETGRGKEANLCYEQAQSAREKATAAQST